MLLRLKKKNLASGNLLKNECTVGTTFSSQNAYVYEN